MTPAQATTLRAMIRNLVKAEIANSWKGGGDPEDIPKIEADLEVAKTRLNSYIRKIVEAK